MLISVLTAAFAVMLLAGFALIALGVARWTVPVSAGLLVVGAVVGLVVVVVDGDAMVDPLIGGLSVVAGVLGVVHLSLAVSAWRTTSSTSGGSDGDR